MPESSLKNQAQEIMGAVDHELQQAAKSSPARLAEIDSTANAIVNRIFGVIADVDLTAAAERVKQMREKYPNLALAELSQRLIRDKCQRSM